MRVVRKAPRSILLCAVALVATACPEGPPPPTAATVTIATAGNDTSAPARISADGSHAVFASIATNLGSVPDANGSVADVFVVNRTTHAVQRVTNGNQASGIISSMPSGFDDFTLLFFTPFDISADGSAVAFVSQATDIAGGQSLPNLSAYRQDLTTGQTTRVAGGEDCDPGAAAAVTAVVISADGLTTAANVICVASGSSTRTAQIVLRGPGVPGGYQRIVTDSPVTTSLPAAIYANDSLSLMYELRFTTNGAPAGVDRIDVAPGTVTPTQYSFAAGLSGDGTSLLATTASGSAVVNTSTGAERLLPGNENYHSISTTGRYVGSSVFSGDSSTYTSTYQIRDLDTGSVRVVATKTSSSGAVIAGVAHVPGLAVSTEGKVAFSRRADGLTPPMQIAFAE